MKVKFGSSQTSTITQSIDTKTFVASTKGFKAILDTRKEHRLTYCYKP